jgi:acyl-CoA reductase-like NAD-dependent aldehyde dehydrogenase
VNQKKLKLANKLFINNEYLAPSNKQFFDAINPSNEEIICSIPRSSSHDVDLAVKSAHKAFHSSWSLLTPFDRGQLLFKFAEIIEKNIEKLSYLESLDVGKPLSESKGDISGVVNCFKYNAGAADKMEGATIPLGPDFVDYTELVPLGVTAHIVPWNFPLGMAARSLAPALAAGCTIVLKPAEQSSLSALALGDMIKEASFPPGVINIITGFGEDTGAELVKHPLVRGITFTGSVETGQKIYENAAKGIKPLILELGGKNPMIVFPDANISKAVDDAIEGSFGNTGQVCSSSSRLYLHNDISEKFIEEFQKKASLLKIGPPEEGPDLGPLVSKEHYEKVMKYIKEGIKDGAKLRFGGTRPNRFSKGYYVVPTLFEKVDISQPLAQDEIFGPVAIVHNFHKEEGVIEMANSFDTGLVAGIYSQNISKSLRLAKHLDFGSVWINGWFIGGLQAPTGGVKMSGIGRERGLPGIRNYYTIKNIGIKI